ncbi:TPA: AAA family ATPase, partial [Klebsiella pneumoniae]
FSPIKKDTSPNPNQERLSFLKYIEDANNFFGGKNFNIKFDLFNQNNLNKEHYEWLIYLMSKGGVKVKNLMLTGKNDKASFSFNQASSGQQCIMTMMIGIAGAIEDNSLICIDEPEISLHPQWQLDFIKLLQETFSHYYGCHFLIATHSPQIVSGLETNNAYICSLERNELHDAITTSKKSADYQLAEIFKSPGFKNEYLLRVLLSFLTNPIEFLEKSENGINEIERIIKLKEYISPSDSVFKLICLAEKVVMEGKDVLNLK